MDSRTPERNRDDIALPAAETLRLMTDETRRAILTTLWTADDTPLRFSTLRRRSNVGGSARFNYHLQQLRDDVVRDSGDGYELTARGERFVAALTEVPSLDGAITGTIHATD